MVRRLIVICALLLCGCAVTPEVRYQVEPSGPDSVAVVTARWPGSDGTQVARFVFTCADACQPYGRKLMKQPMVRAVEFNPDHMERMLDDGARVRLYFAAAESGLQPPRHMWATVCHSDSGGSPTAGKESCYWIAPALYHEEFEGPDVISMVTEIVVTIKHGKSAAHAYLQHLELGPPLRALGLED